MPVCIWGARQEYRFTCDLYVCLEDTQNIPKCNVLGFMRLFMLYRSIIIHNHTSVDALDRKVLALMFRSFPSGVLQ